MERWTTKTAELFSWFHSPLAFPRALDFYDLSEDHANSNEFSASCLPLEQQNNLFWMDELPSLDSQKLSFFGPKLGLLFYFSPWSFSQHPRSLMSDIKKQSGNISKQIIPLNGFSVLKCRGRSRRASVMSYDSGG